MYVVGYLRLQKKYSDHSLARQRMFPSDTAATGPPRNSENLCTGEMPAIKSPRSRDPATNQLEKALKDPMVAVGAITAQSEIENEGASHVGTRFLLLHFPRGSPWFLKTQRTTWSLGSHGRETLASLRLVRTVPGITSPFLLSTCRPSRSNCD